jgi:hypothetical protein
MRAATGFYYEFSRILGISKDGLLNGGASELFSLALLLYVVWIGFAHVRKQFLFDGRTQTRGIAFCICYLGVSMAALGYLSLTKSPDYIQARYFSTLLPFAVVIIATISREIKRRIDLRPLQAVFGIALLVGFAGLGQTRAISEQFEVMHADTRLREIRAALDTQLVNGQSIKNFLRDEIEVGNHVFAAQSQLAGHVLDRTTYGLTPALFTDRIFDFDEVRRMTKPLGLRYILIFPNLYEPDAPENANRVILTELLRNNIPTWIEPMIVERDVKLFRIESETE